MTRDDPEYLALWKDCMAALAEKPSSPTLRRVAADLGITPPRDASVDAGQPYRDALFMCPDHGLSPAIFDGCSRCYAERVAPHGELRTRALTLRSEGYGAEEISRITGASLQAVQGFLREHYLRAYRASHPTIQGVQGA